ncbi:hypothetical protein [Acinetobacter brisouii]
MSQQLLESSNNGGSETEHEYVGRRNHQTGQISSQLTTHMPRAQFRHALCDMYNLVKVEDVEDKGFEFPIEKFVEELMYGIRHELQLANSQLFKQFVKFKHEGVLTQYSQKFSRLMDGKLEADTPLEANLTDVLMFHKNEFLNLQAVIKHSSRNNDWYYQSNISVVYKEFQIVMNLLVMYMSIQYKAINNKEYYDDGKCITSLINQVKTFLLKCFDHRIADNLIPTLFIKNYKLFNEYCLVTGDKYPPEKIQKMMSNLLDKTDKYYSNECFNNLYEHVCNLSTEHFDHFEIVIKMLRFINMIQDVHQKLLESKNSPDEPTIEILMLNGS